MLEVPVTNWREEEATDTEPPAATRGRRPSGTPSYLQQSQPLLVVEPLHSCPEPADHYVVVMKGAPSGRGQEVHDLGAGGVVESDRSISAVPAITSSSSLASNTDTSRTSTTWRHAGRNRLWWNSSSRNSRSLRSHELQRLHRGQPDSDGVAPYS
ncbi:hypothetical protein EYF80_039843 [Liparis tanakae]|uniref:Uncharacterized protein n=1 Tax=Liparis tanakae TaxID=230148 RepID=A0A4Z2GA76_9TELE|nr:hypothetical protein EYF80_039843 [Liparis tanakae]